ncbi:hypothetical protein Poly51_41560 [Rubripirellula tenax]|uniref:Zinc-finger domain-containing protein n=1 Tax=Rubripirellula tenax TaxID=2528015 RepID=A0A5C6EM86_9BACT|nr:hypothetical protein [Rubripirellula tenax]TWU50863.1 hypothetical protein Poly51_41560 [Rubripirellula tenax]
MTITCQRFESRMQDYLDRRMPVMADEALVDHARDCVDCHQKWMTWQSIDSVTLQQQLATQAQSESGRVRPISRLAIAAVVLMVASVSAVRLIETDPTDEASSAAVLSSSTTTYAVSDTTLMADVDPIAWWQDVRPGDWINETMPAMRSVREGVAPLGRSLRRAVTILTTGGGDQTT